MPRPLVETLEARRLLAGVTLVTHGFGGSASGWVTTMGNLIAQQSGSLAQQPRYLMTVTDVGHDGGPLTVTSTRLGPAYENWGSSEIVVLLDWSDVAGSFSFNPYTRPTGVVGAAVADKLLSSFSIPDLATPLAQLPLHLVGHSRGASLVSEMGRSLGEHGVWVDHLTYHDPHPVDGVREPTFFNLNFGDPPMRVYGNVQYADNFWRTEGSGSFDFTGEAVNGAYNLQLNESVLSSGGYSNEHSDTHLWYHGTIGPPFADSDGDASVGGGWYTTSTTPAMGPRDAVGWRASRLGRGSRQAGGLKSAGAFRDALTLSASAANLWDNVQISGFHSDITIAAGTSLPLTIDFEDKPAAAGGTRDATITFGLDRDDNPFNGVFSSTSILTSALAGDTLATSIDTTDIAGQFRVFARISNGTNTRYYYAPAGVVITTPGYSKTWIGPASGAWSTISHWTPAGAPAISDSVSIFASDVTLDAAATSTTVAQLKLSGGARLSLGEKNLVIDYTDESPLSDVRAMLVAGAIHSDAAGASGGRMTLGHAEAFDVLNLSGDQTASFAGATVDSTAVLIRYTRSGDANLDGTLDGDDYFRIDGGFAAQATDFADGDFDLSGAVDADDYFLLDLNYARQGAPAGAAGSELPPAIMPAIWRRPPDDATIEKETPLPG